MDWKGVISMQRLSVKDLYTKMRIKEIANPLGTMLMLSIVYNIIYLGTVYISDMTVFYIIQIVMGLISSVVFYWICTLCWNKPFRKQAIVYILFLETVYLGIVTGILPAISSMMSAENVVVQIIGAFVGIGLIPIELIYFYALSNEIYKPKELIDYVLNIMKRHSRTIINWFCIALIVVFFIDTILGGIFSLASGINTTVIASSILLYGNPMMDWMMTLFMTIILGMPLSGTFTYIVLSFMVGLWYGVMELNYVLYIQRKCLDDGTAKNTTHKKKNRTSK